MITATLTGQKSLYAKLRALQTGIGKGGDEAAEKAANYVTEYARDFVAVDTTKLQESIRVEKTSWGYQVVADRSGDSPEVAFFLEYGTARMSPRPFMQPAVDLVVSSNEIGAEIRVTGGLLARA